MANIKLIYIDNMAVSVKRVADKMITFSYEEFKECMGLEDIRLHWLLSNNNMIAGGSVMNWVWGENTNEDIDFFFKGSDYADTFKNFIQNIGFKSTRVTSYAETFFHPDEAVILQVVGGTGSTSSFRAYGNPYMILDNFDLHVCKFAVDCDNIYTTTRAVQDLLKLTIDGTGNEKNPFTERIAKYFRKGFYASPRLMKALRYDKPHYEPKRKLTQYDHSGW